APEQEPHAPVAEVSPSAIDLVAEAEVDATAAEEHTDESEPADAESISDDAAADDESTVAPEPAALHTPLVASASVIAPGRDSEAGPESNAPARPSAGGRSLRSPRRADPPGSTNPSDSGEARPPAPVAPEPVPIVAESVAGGAPTEIAPTDDAPALPPVPPIPPTSAVGVPLRLIADAPTVASPAGNSAGSNTSAIADPHRTLSTTTAGTVPDATGPRVTGASPVPVKRYRPGSPPASPHAGPRALSAAPTEVIGTVVAPWYRRVTAWLAIVGVGVIAALVIVLATMNSDDSATNRIGGRPPAAAPQGHKVIDGDGFGIAAPTGWIVATDPGNTFPQLRRTNWATPLTATDTGTGEAVLVVQLRSLAHQPQVDPELFWTDQVKDAGQRDAVSPGPPLSVHGFRANEITTSGPSGKPLVAASIDTGDRTFLVAVTGATAADAQTEFDRLIQTFDAR
ncbi:MAG: hypothetical protein ABJC79_10875, partial [Acidimicrobiia bacterium]